MPILNKRKISVWVPVFCSVFCTSAFGADFQGLSVVDDVEGFQQVSASLVRTAPILELSFTQHGFSRLMVADRTFRWDDQVGFYAADDPGSGMRTWLTTAAVLVGAGVIVAVATTNCEVTEERIGC